MSQRTHAPIRSPCVQVCMIDGETGFCLGCFRTGEEITFWGTMSAERRDEIIAALPLRRALVGPERFGEC